jgi:hypothetical protein
MSKMTRSEALETLELPDHASAADIQRAFESFYNDFRIRLDNAPTPRLKQTFEERLQRLEQAVAFLQGDQVGASYSDLPASGPMPGMDAPNWNAPPCRRRTRRCGSRRVDLRSAGATSPERNRCIGATHRSVDCSKWPRAEHGARVMDFEQPARREGRRGWPDHRSCPWQCARRGTPRKPGFCD